MSEYHIEGGFPIKGKIKVSGNKNAALPCIAASILTAEPVTLHNIPDIADTAVMLEILKALGASVKAAGQNSWTIEAKNMKQTDIPAELSKKNPRVHFVCRPAACPLR